jgi:peptidoglycan/xylan/chitin deacetylase (PgdA/CDA1 family)
MYFKIAYIYHDVIQNDFIESGFQTASANSYKLNSSGFEQQIKLLSDFCESGNLPKNQVALTFDDGGESFHSIIAPILEKYGFTGYFFISTGYLGSRGFLTREQILDLHKRGHFIGTHSHTHPKNIAKLSDIEIDSEWSISVGILNGIISSKIKTASIPGGFYSEQSRLALLKYGIEIIFTSMPTKKINYNTDKQYIIGRFAIKRGTNNNIVLGLIKNISLIQLVVFVKWRGLAFIRYLLGDKYYRIRKILLKNNN